MADLNKRMVAFQNEITSGDSVKQDQILMSQVEFNSMKSSIIHTPLCLSAMGQLCLIAASAE